jgi:alkylmercury lyase-like protein
VSEDPGLDLEVKLAVYRHFAATGTRPTAGQVARDAGVDLAGVGEAYGRLRAQRVLFLEPDGASIRMAPPFSGVPTQHIVEARGVSYFANCAWDALGIPAALRMPATVRSRCEQSFEPLRLDVGADGPGRSDWVFHCLVPAARWWEDLVFT